MTTQLGDYCLRCGAKSDVYQDSDGYDIAVCPNGHGEQRRSMAAAPEQESLPASNALLGNRPIHEEDEEEEEEEKPARKTIRGKPPPAHGKPAVAAKSKAKGRGRK